MSTTLSDLVRERVQAEGPQIEDRTDRERYIDEIINSWTSAYLLERISDALQYAATRMAARPWL
jgi:hypothetical protein